VWRWLLLAVGLLALHTVGQAFTAGPISDRCAAGSEKSRYQWDHLEWRWLPAPGQYCVWHDTETGRSVRRWAMGDRPEEPEAEPPSCSRYGGQEAVAPDEPGVDCYYVDEDGAVQPGAP
jgi:hypothetical protein